MKLLRAFGKLADMDSVTPAPLLSLPRIAYVSAAPFWGGGDREKFPTTERLHAIADASVGYLTMLDIGSWGEERLPEYVSICDILHARQPTLRLGYYCGLSWIKRYRGWMYGLDAILNPGGVYGLEGGWPERYWSRVSALETAGDALRGHVDVMFPGVYLREDPEPGLAMHLLYMLDIARRSRKVYDCEIYPVLWPRRNQMNPDYPGGSENRRIYPTVTDAEWSAMLGQAAVLEDERTTAGTVLWDAPPYYAGLGWEKWTNETSWVLKAAPIINTYRPLVVAVKIAFGEIFREIVTGLRRRGQMPGP